jgi:cytochrome c oxidase subunit 1
MYGFKKAYIGGAMFFTGFMMHYFPMFILGLQGMPRRYYAYLPKFWALNFFEGIGAYIMVPGIALIFFNLFRSFKNTEKVKGNPWGATTLEWKTSSPPPLKNFPEAPVVSGYPYDFTKIGEV